MTSTGRFLFGDSTPFPLSQNFLELLQAATDACVALLAADARVERARHATVVASTRADDDLRQLEVLFGELDRALLPFLPAAQAATVCEETAQRLHKGTRTAFEQVRQQVTSWRDTAIHRAEQSIGRDQLLGSLVSLVVHHELPDSAWGVTWQAKGEDLVTAQAMVTTSIGLRALVEIGVPAESPWARPVRVGSLIAALPLHVPKTGGWFRSSHLAVEHLDKYLLTGAQVGGVIGLLQLRKTMKDGAPAVEFYLPADPTAAITLRHFDGGASPSGDREPVDPADAPGLRLLWDAVVTPVAALVAQRKRLVDAWFHDNPVAYLPRPGVVAEAIIANLAPLVRELRDRSSAPGELNLKLEVQDGKREEIFIREDLVTGKWAELAEPQRAAFRLYGFAGEPAPEVEAATAPAVDDEFSIVPVSNPEFDYQPMSNPEFRYQPVSDAELGVEPISDPEALRVDPLTDVGEPAEPGGTPPLDYRIEAVGQPSDPGIARTVAPPASASPPPPPPVTDPGEYVAISDVLSVADEDVKLIDAGDEPGPRDRSPR